MPSSISDDERAMLDAFRKLSDADQDGAFACYVSEVTRALPKLGVPSLQAMASNLRKRKLLEGQGRGLHASYWISDKGREALA